MSLELFTRKLLTRGSSLIPPQWDYLKSGFSRNIDKAMNYYRMASLPATGGHPLIRFLMNINVPMMLDAHRYVSSIEAYALINAGQLGFCTSWNAGKIHLGHFYGPGCTEVYVAVDDYVDPDYLATCWTTYSSVEVLAHPKSDLNIQYCNGKAYSNETGLVVIKVNVIALLLQLRCFYMEQMAKTDPSTRQSINRFIGGVVLPNMMKSHCDVALANRIFNRFYQLDRYASQDSTRHVFAQSNYTPLIDNAIDQVIKNTQRAPGRFEDLLGCLPAFSQPSMLDALYLPDVAPTRNINWILLSARLKHIAMLVDMAGSRASAANQDHLNRLVRNLSLYDTYDVMSQRLPSALFFEMQNYIDTALQTTSQTTFR